MNENREQSSELAMWFTQPVEHIASVPQKYISKQRAVTSDLNEDGHGLSRSPQQPRTTSQMQEESRAVKNLKALIQAQHTKTLDLAQKVPSSQTPTLKSDISSRQAMNSLLSPESPTTSFAPTVCAEGRTAPIPGINRAPVRIAQPPMSAEITYKARLRDEARAKIRARKSVKAPRIRKATSQEMVAAATQLDPAPVSRSRAEWEYDPVVRGHVHIDSDTGSTYWFSDSEPDEWEV